MATKWSGLLFHIGVPRFFYINNDYRWLKNWKLKVIDTQLLLETELDFFKIIPNEMMWFYVNGCFMLNRAENILMWWIIITKHFKILAGIWTHQRLFYPGGFAVQFLPPCTCPKLRLVRFVEIFWWSSRQYSYVPNWIRVN